MQEVVRRLAEAIGTLEVVLIVLTNNRDIGIIIFGIDSGYPYD